MIEATITTRGLIGFEIDVVNATSGRGVMSHLFKEYAPYAGEVLTRLTGTILATEAGVTTAYALEGVQERGKLFVGPGEEVYDCLLYTSLQQTAVAQAILTHAHTGEELGIWGWGPKFWVQTGLLQATRDGETSRQLDLTSGRSLYRERYMRDLKKSRPPV